MWEVNPMGEVTVREESLRWVGLPVWEESPWWKGLLWWVIVAERVTRAG